MRGILALTLLGLLSACAEADRLSYVVINPAPHPFLRRDPAEIDIYASAPPVRPHVDVGILEVLQGVQGGRLNDTTEVLATLRIGAALRGCDAIYLRGITPTPDIRPVRKVVTAVCVVFTGGPIAARAPKPIPTEGAVCGPHAEISNPPRPPPIESSPRPASAPVTVMTDYGENRGCRAPLVCSRELRCVSPFQ